MKDLPLRRGQLVTTFGPGSLVISPDGETAIVGSLDNWFYNNQGNRIDDAQYEIQEPRLKTLLRVEKFLAPPDYRAGYNSKKLISAMRQDNTDIYIPLLRFPLWHYCPKCRTLHKASPSERTNRYWCKECKSISNMIQVPFVMVCNAGHISDFPWKEWVHRDENATCEGVMKLRSTSGATLDSLEVTCSCGIKSRSLKGIMTRKDAGELGEESVSELSRRLNDTKDSLFTCPGKRSWMGSDNNNNSCSHYPVAVLKNSINVYYPNIISAIYLPGPNKEVEELIDYLVKNRVTETRLAGFSSFEDKLHYVMTDLPLGLQNINKSNWELAIKYIENEVDSSKNQENKKSGDASEALKKVEYKTLLKTLDTTHLKIKEEWSNNNEEQINKLTKKFNLVNRITKLKETIVLTGFDRLTTGSEMITQDSLITGKHQLFKHPMESQNNWLPAHEVYGEGIFLTLSISEIEKWEENIDVRRYFEKYKSRIRKQKTRFDVEKLRPRNIMVHTLAHIIIDELALTCGYNTSSIRERLYLFDEHIGVLIYTSSGDMDGTFGGLVRMGRKEYLFPLIHKSIEKAKWCSSDPVCTEIGKTSGQGVNQLNGAACHSCSYLPETSCEVGNLLLDRSLLVDHEIGFFK